MNVYTIDLFYTCAYIPRSYWLIPQYVVKQSVSNSHWSSRLRLCAQQWEIVWDRRPENYQVNEPEATNNNYAAEGVQS